VDAVAVLALLPAEAAVVMAPSHAEATVVELARRAEVAVVVAPLHVEAAMLLHAEATVVELARRGVGHRWPRPFAKKFKAQPATKHGRFQGDAFVSLRSYHVAKRVSGAGSKERY
jgi:hypothetical protein